VTEFGAGAFASWAARDFYGAELSIARRPGGGGGGQGRITGAVAGGVLEGEGQAAVRLEVSGQFLVNPMARSGATLYGGLGAAFRGAVGSEPDAYLTLLVGVEQAAGVRRGWYLETGLAGGVFARMGYRWRGYPGWWR